MAAFEAEYTACGMSLPVPSFSDVKVKRPLTIPWHGDYAQAAAKINNSTSLGSNFIAVMTCREVLFHHGIQIGTASHPCSAIVDSVDHVEVLHTRLGGVRWCMILIDSIDTSAVDAIVKSAKLCVGNDIRNCSFHSARFGYIDCMLDDLDIRM